MLIFEEGEKAENLEKTLEARARNEKQTQHIYDARNENRTQDTLVGGKRSHHCATPAQLDTK